MYLNKQIGYISVSKQASAPERKARNPPHLQIEVNWGSCV